MGGTSYHAEAEGAQQEYGDDEITSYYHFVAYSGSNACDHPSFFRFLSDDEKQTKRENFWRAVGAFDGEGKNVTKPEQGHDWQPGLRCIFY